MGNHETFSLCLFLLFATHALGSNQTVTRIGKEKFLVDTVEAIQMKRFEEAENKLRLIDSKLFPLAIKRAYDSKISNFDAVNDLAHSIRNAETSYHVLRILFYEMKSSGHKDPSKLLLLRKSILNEVMDQYCFDYCEDCGEDKTEASNILSQLNAQIESQAVEVIKEFWLRGSILPADELKNAIWDIDENMWERVMHATIEDLYVLLGLKVLIEYVGKTRGRDCRIRSYEILLQVMKKKNDMDNSLILLLARTYKLEIHQYEYEKKDLLYRTLPKSVGNLVFGGDLCIKNVDYNEYLYSIFYPQEITSRIADARKVLTWVPGDRVVNGIWGVEFVGNNVAYIKNQRFNDYLVAEDFDAGDVYTMLDSDIDRLPSAKAARVRESKKWEFSVVGDNIKFRNVATNSDYAFAADSTFVDASRRYVRSINQYRAFAADVWSIEQCQFRLTLV